MGDYPQSRHKNNGPLISKTTFCTSPCWVHLSLLSPSSVSLVGFICSKFQWSSHLLFGFFEFFLSSKICFYTLCFCFPTLIVHFPTKLLGHPPPPPKKEKSHENAPIMIMFEIQRLLLLITVYRYQNVIQYNKNFIIKFITF